MSATSALTPKTALNHERKGPQSMRGQIGLRWLPSRALPCVVGREDVATHLVHALGELLRELLHRPRERCARRHLLSAALGLLFPV